MNWVNKDTEIYCSFAKQAGNTGCQVINSAFYYHGLNKIYKSFSVNNIEDAVNSVKTLGIKGFAITMPYKRDVIEFVDELDESAELVGAANTVINNNGILKAYNTDYLAAREFLARRYDFAVAHRGAQYFKWKDNCYILGNGGYAAAVKAAMNSWQVYPEMITRDNWDKISTLEKSLIYNCTPTKDWPRGNNEIIDCQTDTETGKTLAIEQASYQYKLYTGLDFPINY